MPKKRHIGLLYQKQEVTMMFENETKAWFDCLEAVAIELEASKSRSIQQSLYNVMTGAGITLNEVRWAQEQGYTELDKSMILVEYEGVLMEEEENMEV